MTVGRRHSRVGALILVVCAVVVSLILGAQPGPAAAPPTTHAYSYDVALNNESTGPFCEHGPGRADCRVDTRPVTPAGTLCSFSASGVGAETEADLNLATEARTQHILEGDGPGSGGHLWPGAAGKTPFPASWSSTRIMNTISDIATDPAAWQNAVTQGSRTILTGSVHGVDVRVVVDSQTGEIITGYPTNLPRNP